MQEKYIVALLRVNISLVQGLISITTAMFRFSAFFRWSHSFHYSTVHGSSGGRNSHIIVDFLIESLRFSKKDALSLSLKGNLTHLKSTSNSDLIFLSFKNYGLKTTQIREIISYAPKILTCKAHKTVEPKLRFFQDLGLSGSDLVKLIKKNPDIFEYGLHTRLIPGVNFFKRLLGNDENVVEFINKSRWLVFSNYRMERMSTNVALLQNLGLSNERILKFMLRNPAGIMTNPKLLENKIDFVEKLGVSRDSFSFIHALRVALYITDEILEKKMELFRSFGWSDSDIMLLFRTQPYSFNKSEDYIREKLEFLMKDVGYTPSFLVRSHTLLTLSLNKRVMPRYKMLQILKEKKLVNDKPSLRTLASLTELKFLDFLRRFEYGIPGLCQTYMDSVSKAS